MLISTAKHHKNGLCLYELVNAIFSHFYFPGVMGKTLDECYEVLGLDFNATEGILPDKRERMLDLVFSFHTFSVIIQRNAC